MATSKMKKVNRKETSNEIIRRLRIQNKKLLEQIAKMKKTSPRNPFVPKPKSPKPTKKVGNGKNTKKKDPKISPDPQTIISTSSVRRKDPRSLR
jgi:hypothetical protein